MSVRVLLVDDQSLVRTGFRLVLENEGDIEVVGEAANGEQAVASARRLEVDVVVMDIRMPHLDGIEATRQIVAEAIDSRVLLLTTFDLDELAFAGLRAGASGFLLKDVPPARLAEGIRAVASGDAVLAPRVTRRLLDELPPQQPHEAEDPTCVRILSLTARERDVLEQIASGATNTEIAEHLVLSEATVKGHVGQIYSKLAVRDRVAAVIAAFRGGIGDPP